MSTSSSAASKSLRRLTYLLLATLPLASSGCASRSELDQVKSSQREVRKLLANYTVALEDVRRRLDQVQSGGAARPGADRDLRQRLDRMETRLLELEGRATTTAPSAALEPPPPPAGAAVIVPAAPPPDSNLAAVPRPIDPAQETMDRSLTAEDASTNDPEYRSAVGLVRNGQCKEAIPALRGYVRKSSKSPVADNAQYLIGSCYYQQKDYNRAIVELNEVLLKYPKADKVPSALLMLADAFADSGDRIDARLILQKLVNDHPASEEAQRGKQKLQALSD